MLNTQANTLICEFNVNKMLPVLLHTFVRGSSSVFLQQREPAEGESLLHYRCRSLWCTYSARETLLRRSVHSFMCGTGRVGGRRYYFN